MTSQCIPKDIRILPVEGRVHVLFDGAEIASSIQALKLEEEGEAPRYYLPRADIQPGILELSEKRSLCQHKGEAHYYTIKTLTATEADDAWYYPEPCPQVEAIRDHVAFGGDRIEFQYSKV